MKIGIIRLLVLSMMVISIATAAAAQDEGKRINVPIGDSPSIGPQNAALTIIEFIDYQ